MLPEEELAKVELLKTEFRNALEESAQSLGSRDDAEVDELFFTMIIEDDETGPPVFRKIRNRDLLKFLLGIAATVCAVRDPTVFALAFAGCLVELDALWDQADEIEGTKARILELFFEQCLAENGGATAETVAGELEISPDSAREELMELLRLDWLEKEEEVFFLREWFSVRLPKRKEHLIQKTES